MLVEGILGRGCNRGDRINKLAKWIILRKKRCNRFRKLLQYSSIDIGMGSSISARPRNQSGRTDDEGQRRPRQAAEGGKGERTRDPRNNNRVHAKCLSI